MGFRGQDFAFDSPAAAVAGLVARLAGAGAARPPEAVALDAARGRVLAEDVRADRDSPAFNYSAMDGYAVRAADVEAVIRRADEGASVTLAVVGESRIGAAPPVLPGEPHGAGMSAAPAGEGGRAIRIVTGGTHTLWHDARARGIARTRRMLAATFLAIFFVPLFYRLIADHKLSESRSTGDLFGEIKETHAKAHEKLLNRLQRDESTGEQDA